MPTLIGISSELDAVNTMLAAIGEAPVNALGTGLPDADIAHQILGRTSLSVQLVGWHFNTEYREFIPNDDSSIIVPENTLRADTWGEHRYIPVALRSTSVFNPVDATYDWAHPLKLKLVVGLGWASLPPMAREYITVKAARVFQDSMLGSTTIHGFREKDEAEALAVLKAAETEQDDANMMYDDYETWQIWGENRSSWL